MARHQAPARSTRWSTLVGLAVLAGLVVFAYFAARAAWRGLQELENQLAAAVVAASATVLVSVLSVSLTRLYERRNERLRELHAKRVPVYERFITDWLGLMLGSQGQLDEDRAKQFFISITPDLLVWASDEVLVKWSRERRSWTNMSASADAMDLMFRFEDLLLAMRRDLGHRNVNISRGDVLGLWVNDIDDYLQGS